MKTDINELAAAGKLPHNMFSGAKRMGAKKESAKEEESLPWSEPIPFSRPLVPSFPVELLPSWVRRFVEAVALETETAPDLAAMATLSALATACARRFQVEQRPGFAQPVNIWTLSLLTSGGRKSRVFSLATAPLAQWQAELAEEMRPALAAQASARRMLEDRLRHAERDGARAKDAESLRSAEAAAEDIAGRLARTPEPYEPVLFVSEGTPERLEATLKEQGGRIALLSDEAGMLGLLGGRYSKGEPNLSSLLLAHDGGDVRVMRGKREDGTGGDRFQSHALVTFGLSVQPETFATAMRTHAAFFDTGFAWRFLFAVVPSNLGKRTHDTPSVPAEVLAEYGQNMTELLNLPVPEGLEFPLLRPTPEAQTLLRDWEKKHETRLSEQGDLSELASYGSKLASRLCRIAALFHAAEHRGHPTAYPLSAETMQRALSLAPYLVAHAQALAINLEAAPATKLARKTLEWLKREHIQTFKKRDLHRAINSHGSASDLEAPLADLQSRCFIRPAPGAATYEVNPSALGEA